MQNSAPTPADPSALRAFLDRFHRLTTGDQLGAYREIGRYLAAYDPKEVAADPELDVRARGLVAMRRVAGRLNAEPQRLTAAAYDRARTQSEPSSIDIAKAWGGWKIARGTLVSGGRRETAQQRAVRAGQSNGRTSESYFEGIRLWLASSPPRRTVSAYHDWAHIQNANRSPDALSLAGEATMRHKLGLTWTEMLRVACGEVTLEQATPHRIQPRTSIRLGAADDLIGRGEVAVILDVSLKRASYLIDKLDFPTPTLVIGGVRHWLREDVLAYRQGLPVERRERNGLARYYIGSREIAAVTGYSIEWVKGQVHKATSWMPRPCLLIGTTTIYDRSEVEAAIATHAPSGRRAP